MTVATLEKKLKKSLKKSVQHPLLKWLYAHIPPQPITNKEMHRAYSKAVSILMEEQSGTTLDHSTQTTISRYLSSVIVFIEEYERKEFPIPAATAEEVLQFLMEQNSLSQYDLAKDLGGQPVVSDILNGKRKLTREHIERLSKRFHISPASFYPSYHTL